MFKILGVQIPDIVGMMNMGFKNASSIVETIYCATCQASAEQQILNLQSLATQYIFKPNI